LVVQGNGVRGVELALHVVVDVHVYAVADHSSRFQRALEIEIPRKEARVAALQRSDRDGLQGSAAEVPVPLGLPFNAQLEVDGNVESGYDECSGTARRIAVGGRPGGSTPAAS